MTQRVTPREESHAAVILERARQQYPEDAFVIIAEYNGNVDITCNLESVEETIRCLEYAINCLKSEGVQRKKSDDVRLN